MTHPPAPANLVAAAARINRELIRSDPVTLSSAARARLEAVNAEFLGDVGQEAIRLARRAGLSTVDEAHINSAYEHLSAASGQSSLATIANTLGGLIAGAGAASVYAIAFTSGPPSTAEFVTAIILAVIGVALLAIGLTLTVARTR